MPGSRRGGVVLRVLVFAYFGFLIGLPAIHLVATAFSRGPAGFVAAATSPIALHSLFLIFAAAGAVAVLNGLMGTAAAWVLVRYRIPGASVLVALIDLPFAIPTLVSGLLIVAILGPQTVIGRALATAGMPVAFAPAAILVALAFVTLPLVVRSILPVLQGFDPEEEEAARTLGASATQTFAWVTLRTLLPAIGYGAVQCFSRALAEFGAIVVASGNVPFRTLTAPVFVFGEVEAGRLQSAAATSIVLLAVALFVSHASRSLQRRAWSHDD